MPKFQMCDVCEASFASAQCVDGKLPAHKFNGAPCPGGAPHPGDENYINPDPNAQPLCPCGRKAGEMHRDDCTHYVCEDCGEPVEGDAQRCPACTKQAELIPATGAAYANTCPECGARPGEECTNHLGAKLAYLGPNFTSAYVHRVRLLAEHECRSCGEEIEEDQEGWLCRSCEAAELVQ
jgi:hypothetical protein